MNLGLKSSLVLGVVAAILGGAVATGESSRELGRGERMTFRWQGPFTYERSFSTHTATCSLDGNERLEGTVICAGHDLTDLKCEAQGHAERQYRAQDGNVQVRTDSGQYDGPLSISYSYRRARAWDLFDLELAANVPIAYRDRVNGSERNGSYLLQIGGGTDPELFHAESQRLQWQQTFPIREPGPAGCATSQFNGKTTVAVRLLPTD